MKTRKLLAVVLAVAMLASFISVPVFADGEGAVLEDLGILMGTDEDGVTDEYLASTATRAQAALIHLRLFGLEDEALAFEGTETFMDAATATEFWQPVLEYLKANPELGWQGDDMGYFNPTSAITGQQFTKVLLVALGYVEGTDFTYEETMTFAAGIGLDALADKAAVDLTVEDLAIALVQALGLKTTGVEDWTLISQLVAEGLIDEAAAEAAGFEVMDPAFVVVSAKATGLKKVEVTMSTDIPAGTAIMLKKGTIGIVTTAVIDGATATLTGMFNFAPGTYTVTVGEAVSAPFEIAAETAESLTIGAEHIFMTGEQDLKVRLENQYGEAMGLAGANISVFNSTSGWVFTPVVTSTVKITATDHAEEDDEIFVFVYDPVSQKQASKTLLVKADPYLADIEYVSWTQNVGTETAKDKLYEGDTTAEMVVKCYDQYTNEYVLTDADITTGSTYSNRIQILSSNGDVLSAGAVTVVGGKLMFEAGDQGTAMFTFIIPDRAVVVSSPMITVYALPVLTSVSDFVVVGATDANGQVIAGEANTVTAVGKDQYLEVTDFTSEDAFTFSTTNETILEPDGISVGENKFTVTPDASGKVTVFVFLNNVLQGQFDLSVVAAAAPRYISMVDAPTAMETGVYRVILSGGITVVDQYGRIMEDPFNETWSYEIQASTTEEHVALYTDHDAYILDTDELTAGTDTFTALLTKDDVIQEESGYSFSVRHVAPSEIVSFTADVVDDVLFSDYDYWNTYYQQYLYSIQGFAPEFLFDEDDWNLDEWFFDEFHSAPEWLFTEFNPYSSQLVILGVTADGTEVELLLDEDFIPEDVDLITFSMDEVSLTEWPMRYDEGAFELHEGPSTWKPTIIASGAAVGTCTVKVWVNGVDVASDTVEVMKEVPDVASITAEINEIDGSTVNVYDYWTLPYDFFGFMIAEYMDDYDMDDFIDWLEFSYGDEMGYELDNLYIIFMITLFDVEDQYGVDLARFAAMMEYRLRFTYSYYRETDDSITTYFTLMTPEGTVWDTVKVTNAEDLLFKLIDALDYLR